MVLKKKNFEFSFLKKLGLFDVDDDVSAVDSLLAFLMSFDGKGVPTSAIVDHFNLKVCVLF